MRNICEVYKNYRNVDINLINYYGYSYIYKFYVALLSTEKRLVSLVCIIEKEIMFSKANHSIS